MPFSKPSLFVFAGLTSLLLGGCFLDSHKEVKEYPISAGRYYSAAELKTTSRDSAVLYEDFTASGGYKLTDTSDTSTGTWYVSGDGSNPEKYLVKILGGYRLADGWLRSITDTSFETCYSSNNICFDKCTVKSADPGNGCYDYLGQSSDKLGLWDGHVK